MTLTFARFVLLRLAIRSQLAGLQRKILRFEPFAERVATEGRQRKGVDITDIRFFGSLILHSETPVNAVDDGAAQVLAL